MANTASQCCFTKFVTWLGVLLLAGFWCASATAALGSAERAEVDNELRALLKTSADKHFPGMPLPKIRVAPDLRTFQEGIESARALAYFRCPDNEIVLHPGYVTPTGDSSAWATGLRALRDTLRHEMVHSWVYWRTGRCDVDERYGGHGEMFLRKALELGLQLGGTFQVFDGTCELAARLAKRPCAEFAVGNVAGHEAPPQQPVVQPPVVEPPRVWAIRLLRRGPDGQLYQVGGAQGSLPRSAQNPATTEYNGARWRLLAVYADQSLAEYEYMGLTQEALARQTADCMELVVVPPQGGTRTYTLRLRGPIQHRLIDADGRQIRISSYRYRDSGWSELEVQASPSATRSLLCLRMRPDSALVDPQRGYQ